MADPCIAASSRPTSPSRSTSPPAPTPERSASARSPTATSARLALDELVRIIRPSGIAAIGINAAHFDTTGFGAALDQLVSDGRIRDLRFVEVPIYDDTDLNDPDHVGRVAVFVVA